MLVWLCAYLNIIVIIARVVLKVRVLFWGTLWWNIKNYDWYHQVNMIFHVWNLMAHTEKSAKLKLKHYYSNQYFSYILMLFNDDISSV